MAAIEKDVPEATSAFAQLDLIEATAKRGEALKKAREAQGTPTEASLYQMLLELRRDIQELKEEERMQSLSPDERMLQDLLRELRRDIEALKGEQEQELWSTNQRERNLRSLLLELRQDIEALNQLSDMPGTRTPAEERYAGKRSGVGYALKLGIPLGILSGIAAAFVLLISTGLIRIDTGTAVPPVAPPVAKQRSAPPAAAAPAPSPAIATPDQLLQTANVLLGRGEIDFARQVLTNATMQGSAVAALMLARTYDPVRLAQMYNPKGVAPDLERARTFYEVAAHAGNAEAAARLDELSKVN